MTPFRNGSFGFFLLRGRNERDTEATRTGRSGENPMWVAKQMGHKDVSMVLRVYGRYIPEMDPLAGTRMVK